MGGGHHITKAGYDMEKLENCIRRMQETYDLEIYLEPGGGSSPECRLS